MEDGKMELQIGMHVRNKATGFSGEVTAKAVYARRTTEFLVEGIDANKCPIERWYQIGELEIISD